MNALLFVCLFNLPAPCKMPLTPAPTTDARHDLDFWLGEWDAYWNDSLRGTNSIKKVLDNQVVEENFASFDQSLVGKSWSVYDTVQHVWRQTWVDNTGGYLLLTGNRNGSEMVLALNEPRTRNNKTFYLRMVFSNITHNSFDWDWQRSPDQKTWTSQWKIRYVRRIKE